MKSKQDIRNQIAQKRKNLDPHWVKTISQKIVDNFQQLPAFEKSTILALYKAIGNEVNLDTLFRRCWSLGKRTCIPIYNPGLKIYEMAEITERTRFQRGHYNIPEPILPTLIPLQEIDLIAVPGVAFDPQGNRLGRGGGYYDRFLKNFSGTSIAVAFDFQIFPKVPMASHDQMVDFLVTERETVEVQNEY